MAEFEQTPGELNLTFTQGDDLEFVVLISDEDEQPIDVSTWELAAQVRRRANSNTKVDFEVNMTDASIGRVGLRLASEDTASLALNNVWDLERDISGEILTLVSGDVVALREVTRPDG